MLKISMLLLAFMISCSDKQITCVIRGKVIGVTNDTIILLKATDDIRYSQIRIPIKDSLFEYKLELPEIEAYQMVYMNDYNNNGYIPIIFFPENGEINCTLYPLKDTKKNEISGLLNLEFKDYQQKYEDTFFPRYRPINDSINALWNRDEYFNEEMKKLEINLKTEKNEEIKLKVIAKMDDLSLSGEGLSQVAKYYKEKSNQITIEANQWKYKYIEQNISVLSYYLIFKDLQTINVHKTSNIDDIKRSYAIYSKKFPEHPYTQLIKEMLQSQENIKVGGSFIDFSAPDLKGKMYKLSEIIQGKYALIDLWASWCGSCITTSRSMMPLYEEFKGKGFTICGVAAEINNTDQLIKRIEKEKFPWINLVELDHKNQIWYKYGISNSGGKTFLVDPNGKILALGPTADEVRNILIEYLK
jgi:Peroxiredoxin